MWNNSHLIHQQSVYQREELIRQADQWRRGHVTAGSSAPLGLGLRNRLGSWLIAVGQRLHTQPTAEPRWRRSPHQPAGM